MKKSFLLLFGLFVSLCGKAQTTGTIAIQFYVDANNNCLYNAGEQLVYNVPCQLQYISNTASVFAGYNTSTVTTCNSMTFAMINPSVTPINTLSIPPGSGVTANNSCGLYSNVAYNTNTIKYLPVNLPTTNLGVSTPFIQYYSSTGTFNYSNLTGNQ